MRYLRVSNILKFVPTTCRTSSSLATTFNNINAANQTTSGRVHKQTGLFLIPELDDPQGFNLLVDLAKHQSDFLVDEIVNSPPKSSVVSSFDELSNSLCKVADLAEFVRMAHPDVRFRTHAENASITISNLVEKLNTDTRLYNALKYSNYDDEEERYVANLFQFDFEQSGIHLEERERKQVLHLNECILRLGSIFASKANQMTPIELDKIPTRVRHFFTPIKDRSSLTSLYVDSSDELVRKIAYQIHLKYDYDKDLILQELLKSRYQMAKLCGFPSYAHRATKGSIAGSPELVNEFLELLSDTIRPLAERDYRQMVSMKEQDKSRVENMSINAWDVSYYTGALKRYMYDEKISKCLPYFSLGACMEGLNTIFGKLYDVRMDVEETTHGEVWHNDVVKLAIVDASSNNVLGYIYCDLFERPGKVQQDCHHTIKGGCQLRDGSYQLPIVVLVLNLSTKNSSHNGNPLLLSPSQVDNLFHEMGHAMHSMIARTRFQHVTGTRCSTDLAEVPSILMEFFASDSRVLSTFAKHYSTGEIMPPDLLKCWIESKRLLGASETQLQVFYAALDQAYHSDKLFSGKLDTTNVLANYQKKFYSIPYVPGTAWQLRFTHLIGYGAKYYSYLVSRSIASAIWRKLFAADPLNKSAGLELKQEMLVHGGGKPAELIVTSLLNQEITADFMAKSLVSSLNEPTI